MGNQLVIDATNQLVGRMATHVTRAALRGQEVRILNAEKAVVSGKRSDILAKWKRFAEMGVPRKGPFIHRQPDRLVRRMIRGMLPHKQPRGREAFARILCHIGTPEEFKDAKPVQFEDASAEKLPSPRYTSVGDICKFLGGKWNE